jgi:excisionase family DNA binding protein
VFVAPRPHFALIGHAGQSCEYCATYLPDCQVESASFLRDNNPMDLSHLITPTGAAELAGVATSTIVRAIERGELQAYRSGDGRAVLVERVAVAKWAKAERRPGPKPRKGGGSEK